MEGCPANPQINMLLLCITGLATVLIFIGSFGIRSALRKGRKEVPKPETGVQEDEEYERIQRALYGKKPVLIASPSSSASRSAQNDQHERLLSVREEIDC
jgi:hypothetical protein